MTWSSVLPRRHHPVRPWGNRASQAVGARTVFFACVPKEQCADEADVSIRVLVGPEVITGSTRMKAGSATKLVLNTVTTLSMVQIGKVYENLMVDLNSWACSKLVDRSTRIIMKITVLIARPLRACSRRPRAVSRRPS